MPTETNKPDSPHVIETKKQIKAAFLQLRKKKDIAHINIREITDLAHLNRTSFYRYYLDVYDLQQSVLDDFIAQFQENISGVFQTLLTQGTIIVEELPFNFLIEYQDIMQILLRDPDAMAHLKQKQKLFFKQLLQVPNDDVNADYVFEFIISGQLGIISYWLQHQDTMSLQELFTLSKELLLSHGPLTTLLNLAPETLRETAKIQT